MRSMGFSIGVFDSGLGGLSIYREIRKLLPRTPLVFLADQKNIPYGSKTRKEIRRFTSQGIEFLENKDCQLIVIACNTATTGGIDYYRRKFLRLKFVGVVPPIKLARQQTKNDKIIILSTNFTAKSLYLKNLIRRFANNFQVKSLGCPDLVRVVEQGNIESRSSQRILRKRLDHLILNNYDSLVLGCTHFSFLRSQIKKIYGRRLKIFDPSKAVAKQTQRVWRKIRTGTLSKGSNDRFFTSGPIKEAFRVGSKLLEKKIEFKQTDK